MQVFPVIFVTFLRTPFYRMPAVATSVAKTDKKNPERYTLYEYFC